MKLYKKKIAIIISSLEVGGAEKMVLDLIQNIKEYVQIRLFIIKKNSNSIYDLEAKRLHINTLYFNHRIKVFSLRVALNLKKVLDDYKPDIIHTHLKASTYVYFYNIFSKDFIWIHTIHSIPKVDTKIIRRMFFKSLYNKQRIKLIAVSHNVKYLAQNLYKKSNIMVIKNGIDLNKFKYINNSKGVNLISVGRLEFVKNHDYMLKELSKLHKELAIDKLYLIGDGRRKEHINNLLTKLSLQEVVEIIPYTNKVNEYLNKADIFVLTSFYEGLPLVIIEAMASGLIIIATEATKDLIIDNYNGFIIDLSKEELYLKLKTILSNLKEYEYIRKNALKTALEYSIEKMAEQYLKAYLEG